MNSLPRFAKADNLAARLVGHRPRRVNRIIWLFGQSAEQFRRRVNQARKSEELRFVWKSPCCDELIVRQFQVRKTMRTHNSLILVVRAFVLIPFLMLLPDALAQPAPGTRLWEIQLSINPQSDGLLGPPAVSDDGTIFTANARSLFAVNPSGSVKWRAELGGDGPYSLAAAVSGQVYCVSGRIGFPSHPSTLRAFDRDGATNWVLSIRDSPIAGNFAVTAEGNLIVALGEKNTGLKPRLACVSPAGMVLWETFLRGLENAWVFISIAGDGTIYCSSRNLYALRGDGSIIWTVKDAWLGGPVAITKDGDLLAIGSPLGDIVSYGLDGVEKWRSLVVFNQCIDSQNRILCGHQGQFHNYASETFGLLELSEVGSEIRRFVGTQIPGPNTGSMSLQLAPFAVCADGSIYATARREGYGLVLYSLSSNGGLRWQWPGNGLDPSFARDGSVYVSSGATLAAIKGSSPLANSSWPMVNGGPDRSYRARTPAKLPPLLNAVRWRYDRGFQFTSVGETGTSYALESSRDLVQWEKVQEFIQPAATAHVTEPLATNESRRFYRVRSAVE